MRFTIERLRTLILVAGVLLVIALGVFLALGKYRNRFNRRDLPTRLARNVQEEANELVWTHSVGGHVLYKVRAAKQMQIKKDGKVFLQLHDVLIELFAQDGSRVDRISGNEFDYNPDNGIARAEGPVEITLMKPTVAPAIAPRAAAERALKQENLPSAAQRAANGEIHVKTSGLVFDRNSGEASTGEKVEFSLTQGQGSAIGAKYDAHAGQLVLDHSVELSIQKGPEPIKMFAQHAVFDRDEQTCEMRAATLRYGNDESSAEAAKIHFRNDGSAERLEADEGFSVATTTGGRLAAPSGTLEFDEHSQPIRGLLRGGVTIDSESRGRGIHGTSPTVSMVFAGKGELRSAHLERGVQIASDEQAQSQGEPLHTHRQWTSPVVDIAFRNSGKDRVEPASIHGTGGVLVMGTTQRGRGAVSPEKMSAEEVTGVFGPNGSLTGMTGRGHTSVEETTATGTRETMSGDALVVHLALPGNEVNHPANGTGMGMQMESATVDGHVVIVQQPPAKAGVLPASIRATAGHADYDRVGQSIGLTQNPRVADGGLELTADKLNVSQESGDAFAIGNVKATWTGEAKQGHAGDGVNANFGAEGPTHVVAQQAELKRSGLATFKDNVRLWQQGNSVTAPVIVLDRTKQTLTAQSANGKNPVQVVLVGATSGVPGKQGVAKQNQPSVVRVQAGDLKYSGAERKAVMQAGAAGRVVASTADGNTTSNKLELTLLPPGNHADKNRAAQVDRMTSTGHVIISSGGRRGTGEQLVYTGDTGSYVLTGTAAAPPRLMDPTRGSITGQALIFNSRDDSVSIEGEGRKTTAVTTAPK